MLFHEGLAYSAINIARSALSSFLGVNDTEPVGSHSLVVRFMKSAQRKGVSLPEIINVAGWSNANTFARFYNKPSCRQIRAITLQRLY